jgi:hypothetical protein
MSVAKHSHNRAARSSASASEAIPAPRKRELVKELTDVAQRLDTARATCTTVRLALERQGADYDAEFACCLRRNVSDAISAQIERIGALVGRLGGALREVLS